eukprot:2052113-Pyramimonas_sp.AAC.1
METCKCALASQGMRSIAAAAPLTCTARSLARSPCAAPRAVLAPAVLPVFASTRMVLPGLRPVPARCPPVGAPWVPRAGRLPWLLARRQPVPFRGAPRVRSVPARGRLSGA